MKIDNRKSAIANGSWLMADQPKNKPKSAKIGHLSQIC
jgi:hypothetical protein